MMNDDVFRAIMQRRDAPQLAAAVSAVVNHDRLMAVRGGFRVSDGPDGLSGFTPYWGSTYTLYFATGWALHNRHLVDEFSATPEIVKAVEKVHAAFRARTDKDRRAFETAPSRLLYENISASL